MIRIQNQDIVAGSFWFKHIVPWGDYLCKPDWDEWEDASITWALCSLMIRVLSSGGKLPPKNTLNYLRVLDKIMQYLSDIWKHLKLNPYYQWLIGGRDRGAWNCHTHFSPLPQIFFSEWNPDDSAIYGFIRIHHIIYTIISIQLVPHPHQ